MRNPLPEIVEKGRVLNGPWASKPMMTSGMFNVYYPGTALRYLIVFSSGIDWGEQGLPGEPWEHASVSIPGTKRTPTWEEMCWVKNLFWEEEETVIQIHPPKSEYVNEHAYVLHLFRPLVTKIPLPPSRTVGRKGASLVE